MKRRAFFLLFLSLLLANIDISFSQDHAAINTFINQPNLKHAGIGFKAVDLNNKIVLSSHNENLSLTPGSTMKLITSATALEILGRNYTYNTRLIYDGFIEEGVLKGNLYVEGCGDPSLGSEYTNVNPYSFLETYLSALHEAGVEDIEGDIVALDQLFGYEGVSQKWLWEDLGNAYSPGIYGISLFDNMFRIELQSFGVDKPTQVLGINPEVPGIELINEITGAKSSSDNSYVAGVPFSYKRRLYGSIPCDRNSFMAKSDIPDPGYYLAYCMRNYLIQHGIKVHGEATSYRLSQKLPSEAKELTGFTSPKLSSLVRIINVRSNNHYAEHLYHLLTTVRGINIPAYWERKGLDASALFMYDGSGISPANAISAGFLTDILAYMYNKEGTSGAFFQSLPLAGEEGTVRLFLRNTTLSGKAHIKSGSISNVQSYAGYIEKNGNTYAFAILVNNYTGTRSDLRKSIEQLLLGVF